jgi:hypothetical protein
VEFNPKTHHCIEGIPSSNNKTVVVIGPPIWSAHPFNEIQTVVMVYDENKPKTKKEINISELIQTVIIFDNMKFINFRSSNLII